METRAHHVLIGAFMLAAIAAALLFSLWLGSVDREFDEYDVVFQENISGLSVGGDVLLSGVRIGEVRSLDWAENDPNRVIARVRVEKGAPIKKGAKAELELVGITGVAAIQFSGGQTDEPLLKEIQGQTKIPVIIAEPSNIAQLLEGSGEIVANINQLLSPKNTETVSAILENIQVVTEQLAENKQGISDTVSNIEEITENLASFTARLDSISDKLDRTMTSVEGIVSTDAKTAFVQFAEASDEAVLLLADMRQLLEDNRDAIDAFAVQGLGQTSAAMTELRRLIQTTDGILREIERDPSRFFFGDTRPSSGK